MDEELNRIRNLISSSKGVNRNGRSIRGSEGIAGKTMEYESGTNQMSTSRFMGQAGEQTIVSAHSLCKLSFKDKLAATKQEAENLKKMSRTGMLKGLLRCKSEHQNLDPSRKGRGTMLLHDYMNQRDTLLTARYGEGGKGFFHERVSP